MSGPEQRLTLTAHKLVAYRPVPVDAPPSPWTPVFEWLDAQMPKISAWLDDQPVMPDSSMISDAPLLEHVNVGWSQPAQEPRPLSWGDLLAFYASQCPCGCAGARIDHRIGDAP